MRLTLLLAITALWPGLASAQDWATRAFCDVTPRPVTKADFAPHDLNALQARASDISHAKGRFWQIESPSGAVSHLWGTFHVSNAAILDLPDAVKSTIADARAVALEIDFTFPDREAFLTQYDLPGRYRDPGDPFAVQDPLDLGFVSPAMEGWIYDRLFDFGTFDDALYVLTYAGLAELLLSDPCEDFIGGAIPVQDDYIQTLGHIAGADIIGLEAPGQFLTDLAEDEETAKAIIAVYTSYLAPQDTPAARIAAFQLYLEGRLGLLAAWDEAHISTLLGESGRVALEKTNAYLLTVRNNRFVDRLTPELDAGGVFVAVGAAHLPGETGLVAMLGARGYTLTRIPLPGEVE